MPASVFPRHQLSVLLMFATFDESFLFMFFQMLGLLAHAEADLEVLEKLQVPADRITELFKDIESTRKQVTDLEYQLDTTAQGARTIEAVAADISSVEKDRYYFGFVTRFLHLNTVSLPL